MKTTERIAPRAAAENWQEQLRRGGLELAILLSLTGEPRYGLEIIRHLEALSDLVVTEGTIYPIMARLDRDGLVASEWRESGAHPRKYYRLTARGRSRVASMTDAWRTFAAQIERLIAEAKEA